MRPHAAESVAELKRAGIGHVIMLTGDNCATANAIAIAAGIDEVHAGLSPEQKASAVKALEPRYGKVAMVGDGVNDAPTASAPVSLP